MKRKQISICLTSGLALFFAMVPTATAKDLAKAPPPDIDPANFVSKVDNEFFPLEPGTTFYYEGMTEGVPTTDEVFVTHETKEILGVTCTVVRDRVFEDGELVEEAFDFYAQDENGNVWYFGEHVTPPAGSWEAGKNGAKPGIIMLADPQVDDHYFQERAPGVAVDQARVLSLDASACVPYGCFDDLLVAAEWTELEPGVVALKYYAEDVGFIFEVMIKGGDERLELVSITEED